VHTMTCAYCGKEFTRKRRQTYCCQPCAAKGRGLAQTKPALNLTCERCGRAFSRKIFRRFCGHACSASGHSPAKSEAQRRKMGNYTGVNMKPVPAWRRGPNASKDFTGRRWGSFTVTGRDTGVPPGKGSHWRVRCDCGRERTMPISNIYYYLKVKTPRKYCGKDCPLYPEAQKAKRDRRNARGRAKRRENVEQYRKYARESMHERYWKDPEKSRLRNREYRAKNPEKWREIDRRQAHLDSVTIHERYVLRALKTSKKNLPPQILEPIVRLKRAQLTLFRAAKTTQDKQRKGHTHEHQSSNDSSAES